MDGERHLQSPQTLLGCGPQRRVRRSSEMCVKCHAVLSSPIAQSRPGPQPRSTRPRSRECHSPSLLNGRGSLLLNPQLRLGPVRDAGLDHREQGFLLRVPDGRAASDLVPALTGRRIVIGRTMPGGFTQSSLTWRRASAGRAHGSEKLTHLAILFDELWPCNMDQWHCAFNPNPDAACSEVSNASGSRISSSGVPLWDWRRTREAPSESRSCP